MLYSRYYKPVYTFMLQTVRSRHDAEDIAQETFAHLWNMREKIDPSRNIAALIFVIARRAAVDLYRRAGRSAVSYTDQAQDEVLCSGLSPEELLENTETKLLLDIAIERMPARQREVFSLHYRDSLSAAEIAERLGLSYENVRKHIYNGKQQLREVITAMLVFLLLGGQ